jgi:hypothetical protein
MKKRAGVVVHFIALQIFLGLLAATCGRADTALTISSSPPLACLTDAELYSMPPQVTGSFTLSGVFGTGTVQSTVTGNAPMLGGPPEAFIYVYTINMSNMSSPNNHCVKLLIHFGTPDGCGYEEVFGDPSTIQSATLAAFGDITFAFSGGCLNPGQPPVGFTMFSEAPLKTNIVTVIDDYVNPTNNQVTETRINVPAIVPDIAPDPPPWLLYQPINLPYAWFQGNLNVVGTNQFQTNPVPVTGPYDFTLQLFNEASNGLATSQLTTQTVQVVNGLFNVPLPFDPISLGGGSGRWLNIGVRDLSVRTREFTPLGPPLPVAPTPQAFYAFTAGTVADLGPGQAVTSLNGLTDAVNLQAGNGILLDTFGNTITISAPGAPSDKNLKTDFTKVMPEDILNRLAALPIQGWRYTNEIAGVHHVGPMAQDFKAAFGLGQDDKFIGFVDEQGVALAAIQALDQKLNDQLKARDAEIADLKSSEDEMERILEKRKASQSRAHN